MIEFSVAYFSRRFQSSENSVQKQSARSGTKGIMEALCKICKKAEKTQNFQAGSISPKNWIYFLLKRKQKFLGKYVQFNIKPESIPNSIFIPNPSLTLTLKAYMKKKRINSAHFSVFFFKMKFFGEIAILNFLTARSFTKQEFVVSASDRRTAWY